VQVAALAWIVFASLIVILRYALLPNITHFRDDLERIASHASGENVRIGAIEASWHGLRPSLSLRDVEVVDPVGGQNLALPSVRATLSWQTLLTFQLRLASLEVDAPQLTIRRDAAGQLYVAGFPLKKKATPDDKAAEWLLAQDEVRIHGAQLVWRDEMDDPAHPRAGPRQDLILTDITFALVRSGLAHRVAVRAKPPASLAAPIDLRAVIRHPVFGTLDADPSAWSGELFANVGTGDIVAWREWLPLPSTIDSGHGRARVWMTFAKADDPAGSFARRLAERIKRPIPVALDRIANVTADLALDDVAVHWGAMADAPEYSALGSIDGRVVGSQTSTEQRVAAIHMALQPRGGAKVAPTDFEMHRTIGATLDDESGEASLGARAVDPPGDRRAGGGAQAARRDREGHRAMDRSDRDAHHVPGRPAFLASGDRDAAAFGRGDRLGRARGRGVQWTDPEAAGRFRTAGLRQPQRQRQRDPIRRRFGRVGDHAGDDRIVGRRCRPQRAGTLRRAGAAPGPSRGQRRRAHRRQRCRGQGRPCVAR
jgi:hypothetical protein